MGELIDSGGKSNLYASLAEKMPLGAQYSLLQVKLAETNDALPRCKHVETTGVFSGRKEKLSHPKPPATPQLRGFGNFTKGARDASLAVARWRVVSTGVSGVHLYSYSTSVVALLLAH